MSSTSCGTAHDARAGDAPLAEVAAVVRLLHGWLRVTLAFAATAVYFVPWHRVYETDAGARMAAIFNCQGARGSGPARDTGVTWLCSGYAHFDEAVTIPLLGVALVVVGCLALFRWGPWRAALQDLVGIGLCAGLLAGSFQLFAHMFERVEQWGGEHVFHGSVLGLALLWLAGPVGRFVVRRRGRAALGGDTCA